MGRIIWDLNPSRDKRFISSLKCPDQLWGHPASYLPGTRGSFPRQNCLGMRLNTSAKVKNEWSYPPLPLYAFMVCKENSSFTFLAQCSASEIESLNVKSGLVFNMLILQAHSEIQNALFNTQFIQVKKSTRRLDISLECSKFNIIVQWSETQTLFISKSTDNHKEALYCTEYLWLPIYNVVQMSSFFMTHCH